MNDVNVNISKESTKQKLTLGIDRNVIEKAKAAGINISAITENVLKTMTYKPKNNDNGNTRQDVARAYEELLHNILFFLMKYSQEEFQIDVGEVVGLKKLRLYSNMRLSEWDVNDPNKVEPDVPVERVLDYLYGPMKILENAITVLTELAQANKEKIAELKFAMRIVKALSDNKEEGEHKK